MKSIMNLESRYCVHTQPESRSYETEYERTMKSSYTSGLCMHIVYIKWHVKARVSIAIFGARSQAIV